MILTVFFHLFHSSAILRFLHTFLVRNVKWMEAFSFSSHIVKSVSDAFIKWIFVHTMYCSFLSSWVFRSMLQCFNCILANRIWPLLNAWCVCISEFVPSFGGAFSSSSLRSWRYFIHTICTFRSTYLVRTFFSVSFGILMFLW